MSSQRQFFHVLLFQLLLLFHLSCSVFSTPSFPPTTSSSVYHWKSPPTRRNSRPQKLYGSAERHLVSVDGFVNPQPDPGTSGPPYASAAEPVRPMDGESKGKGEGRAGQLEPESGTDHPGFGKAGENRGLRIDEWEKKLWRENDKRKWGQNSMSVWGKRTFPDGGNEKRKWGANTMGVWGKKRSSPDEKEKKKEEKVMAETEIAPSGSKPEVTGSSDDGQTGSSSGNARHLRKRSIFDWRSDDLDLDLDLGRDRDLSKRSQGRRRSYPRPYGGPKRNWETNTMKVWGKRNYPNYPSPWEEANEEQDYYDVEPVYGNKRKWTSDNAIRIWG